MSDSSRKAAPNEAGSADWRAIMESFGQGKALPSGADDPRVVELLTHWDELPRTLLDDVARHPVHGPRLKHLRRVQTWLAGSACPPSEELYDFARGPGYAPLGATRRQDIEDHLAHCGECEGLIESLAGSPPLPLDLSGAPRSTHEPAPLRSLDHAQPSAAATAPPLPRSVERWLPLAAAAAVLAIGLLVFKGDPVDAGDRWPTYASLRGVGSDGLMFPRGSVLVPGSAPGISWASAPAFEVDPVAGASHYRAVVRRHGGGAFSEGVTVLTLTGGADELSSAEPLVAGHYTWEAWATVDGLERLLGERDFEVLDAPDMGRQMSGMSNLERVHALHQAGYWTDARDLARRMPASVGRDAYLGGKPGR